MRVHICTDLEGISGVTLFSQTREDTPEYQVARHLLMGDINAAVQGCLDGGASHVCVLDGHGHPLNVIPEEMHPGAEYLCGRGFPGGWGIDESYDCAMVVGAHAMNRTPDGVLCHTQSSRSDARYWYDGEEYGEIGQEALVYGHFGIPIVMVTGDVAACREARKLLRGDIVTVAVKEGYGRECCRMVAPVKAREMIREGAREALTRVDRCAPHALPLPFSARMERLEEVLPDNATLEQIAAAPHVTFEKTCESQLDIYRF